MRAEKVIKTVLKTQFNIWCEVNFKFIPSCICLLFFIGYDAQYKFSADGGYAAFLIISPKTGLKVIKLLLLRQLGFAERIIKSNCKSKWRQIPLFIK